ncbi:hypothetical protein Tco_0650228 [Tanacetum coccineum]
MGMNRVILFEIHCRSLDINATVSFYSRYFTSCVSKDIAFGLEDKTGSSAVTTSYHPVLWNACISVGSGKSLGAEALEKPNPRSERTISPTPLYHVALTNLGKTTTAVPNDTAENATNFEKEVVDLSGNTRMTTSPVVLIHFTLLTMNYQRGVLLNPHLCQTRGFVMISVFATFSPCKELVSHLATLAEEEFWGSLSNVEVSTCVRKGMREVDVDAEERVKVLEGEKVALVAELAQAEMDTMVDALMKVSPDIPPSATEDRAGSSTTDDNGDAS